MIDTAFKVVISVLVGYLVSMAAYYTYSVTHQVDQNDRKVFLESNSSGLSILVHDRTDAEKEEKVSCSKTIIGKSMFIKCDEGLMISISVKDITKIPLDDDTEEEEDDDKERQIESIDSNKELNEDDVFKNFEE
jgi:hypothetical protein